ncbi:hypothetical protein THAOC_35778, partial [Thalassiosira oceanica]
IPRLFELAEHIIEAYHLVSVLVHVEQRTRDVEERAHLVAVLVHDQRVRLAGRLEDVCSRPGVPAVLPVPPAPPERHRVDGGRVSVPSQHAAPCKLQQIYVVTLRGAEAQGPEGQAVSLGDPYPRVIRLVGRSVLPVGQVEN